MSPPHRAARLFAFLLAIAPAAVGQDQAVSPAPSGIEALRWSGERAQGAGPPGRRLFAGHLEAGLGFRGRIGYGDLAHGFDDPLLLEVLVDGRPLTLERARVEGRATHQSVTWDAPGFQLLERKFVTEDDELVDELELLSHSDTPLDLELSLWGAATPELARLLSEFRPLDLKGSANLSPALKRELGLVDPGAGGMTYDGVGFTFARTPGDARAAFVALGGGEEGEALADLPRELALALPSVAPARATLHLLCAAPTPDGLAPGDTPALFDFHFDDGAHESVPWPSIAERMAGRPATSPASARLAWHLLLLPGAATPALRLAYTPPPGRFVERLVLRKGNGPEVPVLFAGTFELPPPEGRPAAQLGSAGFLGDVVHVALAGEDFVPVVDDRGRRRLRRSIHLEPGASLRLRAVFSSGPRALMSVLRALDRTRDEEVFARQRRTLGAWFEEFVPEFSCSDRDLEAAWYERWYRVRRSMLRIDLPAFSLPIFYRGLAAGEDRIELAASAPLLDELRWLRDLRFAQGQLRALCKAQRPGARLTGLTLSSPLEPEAHDLAAAAFGVVEVTASRQLLAEVWPSLVADFEARRATGDGQPTRHDADHLRAARYLARGLRALEREEEVAALCGRPECQRALAGGDDQRSGDALGLLPASEIDRIVREVVGLVPSMDDVLELRPLPTELEHFRLRRLRYHGHELDVSWDRPGGERFYTDAEEGYSARLDGRLLFRQAALGPVRVELD